LTRTYQRLTSGNALRINLHPAQAVRGGARWRISGGSWKRSGEVETGLEPGPVEIQFTEVPGWQRPEPIQVHLEASGVQEQSAAYDRISGTGAHLLYFPQVVDILGYATALILMPGDAQTNVPAVLNLFQPDGTTRISGIEISGQQEHTDTVDLDLAPNGAARLQTFDTQLGAPGWVEVESDAPLSGLATFELRSESGLLGTAVGIVGVAAGPAFRIPVTDPQEVGLALVNPGQDPIDVVLEFYTDSGELVAQHIPEELAQLPGRHQAARFLSELGAPEGFEGVVLIRAEGGTVALTGLLLRDDILTALPAVSTD
jgi:hypothetical protein